MGEAASPSQAGPGRCYPDGFGSGRCWQQKLWGKGGEENRKLSTDWKTARQLLPQAGLDTVAHLEHVPPPFRTATPTDANVRLLQGVD